MAQLFCVPRDWCDANFAPGVTGKADVSPTILDDAPRVFIERADAETRDDVVQVATYAIVRSSDRVLYYGRGGDGGENALLGRLSIGVGGHVEDSDLWSKNGRIEVDVELAALRELREELVLSTDEIRLRGYIRNFDDAVGLRHLGLLYDVWTDRRKIASREPDKILSPTFATVPTLLDKHYDRMERWSQLVIMHLAIHGRKEVV